ncbi:MAG: hypothetical protein JW822_03220 [Spirochaetales bacterium]|nr:hypothetical protein [Spirochaetales bacterium]
MIIKNKPGLLLPSIISVFLLLLFPQCVSVSSGSDIAGTNDSGVLGFGFLVRIPGLWSGPVFSDTPAGSFPMWYVDFRPVSAAQVSQYTSLDPDTNNDITFFIVKHDNRLKVAMRTYGVFKNKGCVTYEVIEVVNESKGYYKFCDFQSGDERAYTEFTFKKDELLMEVYTNKFNSVKPLQLHSRWEAKLSDRSSAQAAIAHFNYPQPVMVKDFSDVFKDMHESIYFDLKKDPYNSLSQPYVGKVTVNISIDKKLKVEKKHEIFLVLTTKSLFEGYSYKEENLKYISKCIFLPVNTKTFTFNNIHPGTYYLYSYNDINGDKRHLTGDYYSSNILNNAFTLDFNGHVTVNTVIDSVLP